MSIDHQLKIEIESIERDYCNGYISLQERNARIECAERNAREEQETFERRQLEEFGGN